MAGLFARERGDGRGQRIEVPMLDAYAAFMLPDVIAGETFLPKEGPALPFNIADVQRPWQTADGYGSCWSSRTISSRGCAARSIART